MITKMKQKGHDLLRKSEKYTKTDMVYLAKGGSWLVAGQFVASLSAFLLSILFANLLSPEFFGKYKFVLSVVGIISILTLPGINTALTRSVAKGFLGSVIIATKERIRWGFLAAIVCLLISSYYYLQKDTELALAFLLSAFFIPFFETLNIYQAMLNGKKDFALGTKYQVISQIVGFIAVALSLVFSDSLLAVLFAYYISLTLSRLFFLLVSYKKYEIDKDTSTDTHMLSYGKNLTVMSTLGVISSHLDKIILFHFLGAAQVAIYTFAIAIPEQLKSFIAKLSTLAFPKFSEKSKEEIRKTIWIKLLLMGIILFLISVVYIALAPIIFSVLFPLYTDSILLSQIFAASLFTLVINIPLDVLRALKKTKELYYFNISTAIVRITLAVILIYFYGLTGAIFSWIFYRVISLIYLLILLKKTLN